MNLETLNVQEMNAQEQTNVDGGFFGLDDLLIGLAVSAATIVMTDWDHFKDGLGL